MASPRGASAPVRAGIALGSNLGDRMAKLRAAVEALRPLATGPGELRASGVYETEPVDSGPEAQAYLNAVVEIEYSGQPANLLDALQAIEARMGRPSKRPRNAPRVIDLDVLYTGNLVLSTPEMVIPHPRLHLRRFVLQPLSDIRPELVLPGRHASIGELLASLQDTAKVDKWPEPLLLTPLPPQSSPILP